MQRHHLDARAVAHIGLGIEPRQRVDERRPLGMSPPTSCASTRAKNFSAASTSIASVSVAPPPSASHAPLTRAATPARPASIESRAEHRGKPRTVPALGRQIGDGSFA
jgi:hypothetical protein